VDLPLVVGLHCSHEQHAPSALLRHAARAADKGLGHAMCSDHFRPWSERQGHSGFTWSWLGAALARTPLSFGTVCAPGQRYHPAVIAQAVATLVEMFPGRFWLAVGSGEAVNEGITGDAWPPKSERHARLLESVAVMRALWAGETVTLRGHVQADRARLYVHVSQPPLLLGAALTPATARWVAGWADGLITVAGPRDAMRAVVDAFLEGGGGGKPMFLQVALSFAPQEADAVRLAMDQWRHCVLGPQQLADLPTPVAFDDASHTARMEDVMARVRVSGDVGRQIAWLQEDVEMGFRHVYLHNVAREHQEVFIDVCATHILPSLLGRT
jgi:probable non-F420 flavinoid oxidoreductase